MSDTYAAHKSLASRIKVLCSTQGYGNLSLSSGLSGSLGFGDVFSVGEMCYYTILGGTSFEVGIGKLLSTFVLERTIVLESSNGGAALNLSGLPKVVVCEATPDSFYDDEANIMASQLPRVALGTLTLVNDTGYFVYAGKGLSGLFAQAFVEFQVTTAGAGAQTADVGIFTTPDGPDKTAKTLQKMLTTNTVDALTSTGMKRNTASFNNSTAQRLHYWVGIRTAMATTQPTLVALAGDMSQGHVLFKATCGAFAALGTTFSTTLVGIGTAVFVPDLRLTGV